MAGIELLRAHDDRAVFSLTERIDDDVIPTNDGTLSHIVLGPVQILLGTRQLGIGKLF